MRTEARADTSFSDLAGNVMDWTSVGAIYGDVSRYFGQAVGRTDGRLPLPARCLVEMLGWLLGFLRDCTKSE